jgi:hypothetical protein
MEETKAEALKTPVATNSNELVEVILYSAVALLVPFSLGHPQLLVGIIVNAALVLAALNLKDYKVLPIALLPSMGVIARGLIFGPFTIFLVYLAPFIWIGNLILVYIAKKVSNKWISFVIGAGIKALFLYSVTMVMIKLGILPKIFAVSMGIIQLYTALAGGLLAVTFQSLRTKMFKKPNIIKGV